MRVVEKKTHAEAGFILDGLQWMMRGAIRGRCGGSKRTPCNRVRKG
jgi:hypothetical protein